MLNLPFTLLAGAALSVALVTAAPVHDLTLNTPPGDGARRRRRPLA